MSTPSEELAKLIIKRLVSENLFTRDDAKKQLRKLAEGKLQAADWRLAVEKAIDTEAMHE